ncbi:MAG TPA: DUF2235 domain-containing protein [Bacteroidota bacterium]|nr:DUF2235 domain-containing protein [Bacteroidota bacterium]
MRTYVVCMDGTWNHPGQRDIDPIEESERVSETNVLRIYRFLTGILHTGNVPVHYGMVRPLCASFSASDSLGEVLYLNGVGSSGTVVNKAWAGATGTGTSERIMDAYRFLAERHVSGDRIFAFGFSRGAFAARSLAGFLQYIGLPKVPRVLGEEELEDYFRLYRERGAATYGPSLGRNAQVDFLGLWDTVGALAFGGILSSFHLISPENVNHVAHALALDERRGAFKPEYWESTGRGQGVDEVWFPGVHTNVGGGYAEEGLSNIALAWVVSKAVEAGLPTKKEYIQGWYAEMPLAVNATHTVNFSRSSG